MFCILLFIHSNILFSPFFTNNRKTTFLSQIKKKNEQQDDIRYFYAFFYYISSFVLTNEIFLPCPDHEIRILCLCSIFLTLKVQTTSPCHRFLLSTSFITKPRPRLHADTATWNLCGAGGEQRPITHCYLASVRNGTNDIL